MKKMKVGLMAVVLISAVLFSSVFVSAIEETNIYTENTQVLNSSFSIESNGVQMVGAADLAGTLSAEYSFDKNSLSLKFKQQDNELIYRLDNKIVLWNGKYVSAPAPLRITKNRFMVPAEFTAKALGGSVFNYYAKNRLLIFNPQNGIINYKVESGDTLWLLSKAFNTSISIIKSDNELVSDSLYLGQLLRIRGNSEKFTSIAVVASNVNVRSGSNSSFPTYGVLKAGTSVNVEGKSGDWYKINSSTLSGYVYGPLIKITQNIVDNQPNSNMFNANIYVDTSLDSVSYINYSIQKGDTIWALAEKFGIPDYELRSANGFTSSSVLSIGQVIKVPVHDVPVKPVVSGKYGEVLDWFKEAQYVFPTNAIGKLIDIQTGKSFNIKRTMGASHSDTEVLTTQDAQIMKEIFGGWSWERRTFILEYSNRRFAVSASGMPHAGVDGVAYMQNVDNRSGDFGYGPNFDRIPLNGMSGHFDMYFLNSLRHVDNNYDSAHQLNVLLSGGLY